MGEKKECKFVITVGSEPQTYYFRLDKEGKPIKVGDGTFGAVFFVEHDDGGEYVVKLLYETRITISTSSKLTDDLIDAFQNKTHSSSGNLKELNKLGKEFVEFAVEFLNDQFQQTYSTVTQRFKHETGSSRDIRSRLRHQGKGSELTGVIEIVGGTTEFRKSRAFEILESTFKELQMEVSDYALVMPYYQWTLKDLLEKEIGKFYININGLADINLSPEQLNRIRKLEFEEETKLRSHIDDFDIQMDIKEKLRNHIDDSDIQMDIKKKLKQQIYRPTGYEILESLGFEDRIKTILPYLLDIARGIRELHWANFFHHDLKPANIFVRGRDTVEAVVGDLGFIRRREDYTPSGKIYPTLRDVLPLGTRHYRSPEQKDYFDICNVAVKHQVIKNSEEKKVVLVVFDPKFQDSIIERGDTLIFSKDKDRQEYVIAKIDKKQLGEVYITLEGDPKASVIKEDDMTQIVLYKKHRARTDLFGLGAIAYDLLTCGRSPERFYDNIRSYDIDPTSDDPHKGDIKVLLDDYRQVTSRRSAKPTAVRIFEPFRHQQRPSEYAPVEFVTVILKCMLYMAKGTYFNEKVSIENDDMNYYGAIDAVFEDLVELSKSPTFSDGRIHNNLLEGKLNREGQGNDSSNFSQTLNELQKLSSPQDIPKRLGKGIFYFYKLIELVRTTVVDKKGFGSFSEMLPGNIEFKSPDAMGFAYSTYVKEYDYKADLLNDSVYARIMRDPQNPYVPNELVAMRRPIQLEYKEPGTFCYRLLDSSPEGDQKIEKGDWIICHDALWRVRELLTSQKILVDQVSLDTDGEPPHNKNLEFEEDQTIFDGVFYKDLQPCRYYLSMLGIYLHQIFFANIGQTTLDKPLAVDLARKLMALYGPSATKIRQPFRTKRISLTIIFQFITFMYLQLSFHENEFAFYKHGKDDFSILGKVLDEATELQRKIEKFLEVEERDFDILRPDFYKKETGWIEKNIPQVLLDGLDFNANLLEVLNVSVPKPRGKLF